MVKLVRTRAFSQAIELLGGPTAVARALRQPVGRVGKWYERNTIPQGDWLAVTELAKARRIRGITLLRFAECASLQKPKRVRRRANRIADVDSGGNYESHPIDQA